MADLRGTFRQPFAEQVAAYRLRLDKLVPTSRWDDIEREAHDSAFMVAGAIKADLLADLAQAVDRAISEGTGFEAFKKDFREIVERRGWHGWTGEGTPKGEAWRMRTIYRTNMQTSYMAGRHAQLVEGNYKYWVYRHSGAVEPRLHHLAWDGLILPPDHPFWAAHYPPNGWGCGCRVFGARSKEGAIRRGGDPSLKLPDDWDQLDPKTGAPIGIGKGWDYAPGRSVANTIRAMTEKTVNWPYALARAYMDKIPAKDQDAFSSGYRQLASLAEDLRRYAQAVAEGRQTAPLRTMGRLSTNHRARITELTDLAMDGYHFTLDPSTVRHVLRVHGNDATEALRGQRAVSFGDFALLPRVLDTPDRIEEVGASDVGRPVVRFTKRIGDLIYFAAIELRGKRKTAALQSMWVRRVSGEPPA